MRIYSSRRESIFYSLFLFPNLSQTPRCAAVITRSRSQINQQGLSPLRYALCYYGNLAQSASAKDSLGIILISTPKNAKKCLSRQHTQRETWRLGPFTPKLIIYALIK